MRIEDADMGILLKDCLDSIQNIIIAKKAGDNFLYEENVKKITSYFCQFLHIIAPQNISQISKYDHDMIKRLIAKIEKIIPGSFTGNLALGCIQATFNDVEKYCSNVEESLNFFVVPKLQLIKDLPYFTPDDWFDRYLELNPILLSDNSKMPDIIVKRIREASYCYVYGFYNACIALCRSIAEGLFKEKLRGKVPDIDRRSLEYIVELLKRGTLNDQEFAWNIIKIKTDANKVLHNLKKDINQNRCLIILKDTRQLIGDILNC